MPNMQWLRAWRLVAVCVVAVVGAAGIELDSLKTSYDKGRNVSDLSVWLDNRKSGTTAWDRYGVSSRTYRRVLALCPDPYSVYDFIALGPDRLLDPQDGAAAIELLRQMLRITPEDDAGWSNLAWLYAISGDTPNAISTELKAISLYRYDYTYYVLLGVFYEQSGKMDEAKAAYAQALVLFPRLERSSFWHALLRRRKPLAKGALQAALTALGQSESSDNDLLRDESRARLQVAHGETSDPQSIIDSINRQIQNLSSAWELQGELYEKVGRWNDAIADYERASFIDKSDPLPHERLAELALKLQEVDLANKHAYQAWWLAWRLRSPSSARATLEFQQNSGQRDGLLPPSLFRETQPSFNFGSTFSRLADLYAQRGDEEQARKLTGMAQRAGTPDENYGTDEK